MGKGKGKGTIWGRGIEWSLDRRERKGEKGEKEKARSGLVALNVNEGVKNLNGFLRPDKDDPFF